MPDLWPAKPLPFPLVNPFSPPPPHLPHVLTHPFLEIILWCLDHPPRLPPYCNHICFVMCGCSQMVCVCVCVWRPAHLQLLGAHWSYFLFDTSLRRLSCPNIHMWLHMGNMFISGVLLHPLLTGFNDLPSFNHHLTCHNENVNRNDWISVKCCISGKKRERKHSRVRGPWQHSNSWRLGVHI